MAGICSYLKILSDKPGIMPVVDEYRRRPSVHVVHRVFEVDVVTGFEIRVFGLFFLHLIIVLKGTTGDR